MYNGISNLNQATISMAHIIYIEADAFLICNIIHIDCLKLQTICDRIMYLHMLLESISALPSAGATFVTIHRFI